MTFNEIPDDRLVPFAYVEFDSTKAQQGVGVMPYKALLVGNRLSSGSESEEVPRRCSSADQAEELYGQGSLLHNMAKKWFENNESTELWTLGLPDDDAGAAATGAFAFSGTASEAGVIYAYVGGERIKVAVEATDDGDDIATAFKAALDEAKFGHLPVSNHRSTSTVYVHMRNEGAFGNDLDLRLNYADGETLPAGVSCSITPMASGAGNPDIQDAIDAIGSEQYHIIVHPYTDDTNMDALEEELLDRWGPLVQNDGVALTFVSDDYSGLAAYGDARNSQFSCVMGGYKVPTSPWQMAAALGAQVAYYGQIDRARPFQTLRLKGCKAPAVSDRFTPAERNLLLQDGIATFNVGPGDVMQIERLVTTFKENALGAADTSYRDLNTVLILSYIRWDWRNYILRTYPRAKLADDGTRFDIGQVVVTPKAMKAEACARFREWESIGLVEDFASFKANLVVERNSQDPNRMDMLLPPNLINQLIVTATQIQFRV